MAEQMELYDEQILHVTQEKFYIEVPVAPNQVLVIDRVSHETVLEANHGQIPESVQSKSICGVMGIVRLLAGPYLIIITDKTKVGEIAGQTIWRVTATDIIPYSRTLYHLTETQMADNKEYLSMIQQVLSTPAYYFSYTYDLSHTMQRLYNTSPDFKQISMAERADQRFLWNGHLLRDLITMPELHRYCLPVIHGFVTIKQCIVNGHSVNISLISRRSCFRAGVRLFMRGLDSEGYAANNVETEQLVEFEGQKVSYIQTRGSIPLFWSQEPDLRYKPPPTLTQFCDQQDGYQRHFDDQQVIYGRQIMVNLINQNGSEGKLEEALKAMVSRTPNSNIRYEAFDFHHECRKMRWDRLSLLIDRLKDEQDEQKYFHMMKDGVVLHQQDGVFRTNCIDCLDRTNVVQSLLSKRFLEMILKELQIFSRDEELEDHEDLWAMYRVMWADNADYISIQYSGTGALKTDFTRTGKRTKLGLLQDGLNSAIRYFKNNFFDGFRQDAVDLFLGNYVVEENDGGVVRSSPLQNESRGLWYLALPLGLLFALAMFFATLAVPAEYSTDVLMYLMFWGAMVIGLGTTMMVYGMEYVNKPRLCYKKRKVD